MLHLQIALLCIGLMLVSCKKEILPLKVEEISSGTTDRLNKIYWLNNQEVLIVGGDRFRSSLILKSDNAGQNFSLQSLTEINKGNYGIARLPGGKLIVVGFDGKWIYSEDDGNSWQWHQLPYWRAFKDVDFFTATEGLLIDGDSFRSGCIYRVSDQGNVLQRDSLDLEMNDLLISDNQSAYIAAFGAVLKSLDKGETWNYLDVKNDNFSAITKLGNELWICGTEGSIFHSPDEGKRWTRLRNGNQFLQKTYHFTDILFLDQQTGYVCGEGGTLLQTRDGGRNWQPFQAFTQVHLRQIEVSPDGKWLLLCGDQGKIFRIML